MYYLDAHYEKHTLTGENEEGEEVLEKTNPFSGLCQHMIEFTEKWEIYFNKPEPHLEALPDDWEEILDNFEKLLILKILRPEKLLFAFSEYVKTEIGESYIQSKAVSMDELYKDSDNHTPIIFVLSQGADPSS